MLVMWAGLKPSCFRMSSAASRADWEWISALYFLMIVRVTDSRSSDAQSRV